MKTNCITLFLFSLFILASCGGGGSLKTNEYLGNIPSVMAEYNKGMSDLQKWGESKQDVKDVEKMMKILQEYKEKEDAIEQKVIKGLSKEFESKKDKEFPVANENPDYIVSGLKMTEANIGKVIYKGEIATKAILTTSAAYCEFQDKEGNVIETTNGRIKYNWSGFGKYEIPAGTYEITVTLKIIDETANVAKLVFLPSPE